MLEMQDPECPYYSDSEDGDVLKGYCVFLTHVEFCGALVSKHQNIYCRLYCTRWSRWTEQ
jgi:hypothetical protein